MEERARKKRPRSETPPPRKERRDSVKGPARGDSSSGITRKTVPGGAPRGGGWLREHGLELNANTARQAVILSEIIGKPVSKRSRRR